MTLSPQLRTRWSTKLAAYAPDEHKRCLQLYRVPSVDRQAIKSRRMLPIVLPTFECEGIDF